MSSATKTSSPNKDTTKNDIDVEDDDSPLLVSEFPPPPYYYRLASSSSSKLQPPDIPTEALKRAANKAASMAAAAKEIAERNRLQAAASTSTNMSSGDGTGDTKNSNNSETVTASESLSQVTLGGAVPDLQSNANEEEDVVAVFGEIVEVSFNQYLPGENDTLLHSIKHTHSTHDFFFFSEKIMHVLLLC